MKIQLNDMNNSIIDSSNVTLDTDMVITVFDCANSGIIGYGTTILRNEMIYYHNNDTIRKHYYYHDKIIVEDDCFKLFEYIKKDFKLNFNSIDLITITNYFENNKKYITFIKFHKYTQARNIEIDENSLFLKEIVSSIHFNKFISKRNQVILVNKDIKDNGYSLLLDGSGTLKYETDYNNNYACSFLMDYESKEVSKLRKFLEDNKIIVKD